MKKLTITQSLTFKNTVSIRRYLNEAGKYAVLSPEEEQKLAQLSWQGDLVARQKMICANLRFVVSIAKRYQYMGLQLEDLINEGNIGLIKSADKFDPSKNIRFISYAVWWIRRFILESIARHKGLVRLPMHQSITIMEIDQAIRTLENKLCRTPDISEIEELVGEIYEKSAGNRKKYFPRSTTAIAAFRDIIFNSYEAPDGFCDIERIDGEMSESDPADESQQADLAITNQDLGILVERLMASLQPTEYKVISMRYGIGTGTALPLDSVAASLDISRERVRQIEMAALAGLRKKLAPYRLTLSDLN